MTITALRQVLVLALTLTLLNGCSLLTPKGGQDALQGELDDLSHWQARGKLSVRSPDDSVTGYLDWKQNQRDFDLCRVRLALLAVPLSRVAPLPRGPAMYRSKSR